jgi:hypothetical protein
MLIVTSVADPDSGSGAFLTPGSERYPFFPDPGSQLTFESLVINALSFLPNQKNLLSILKSVDKKKV